MAKKRITTAEQPASAGLRRGASADEQATSLSALKEQAAGLRHAQLLANLAHVITKPDGSFETWSETLPSLLGIAPGEIATSTRRWLDLIHPADRARFRATALEARARAARTEVDYRLWRKDGNWVHVRQVMDPIPGKPDAEGRRRWFNTLQDITGQVRAQAGINRLNRVYAVLSGINGIIVRVRERQQLLEQACRIAVEAGGFVMAWIGLVDCKASLVVPAASAGNVGDFFETAPMAILETKPGGHGLAGRAVRSKRSVISNDVQNDPQRLMRKELAARGINSLAIIPLVVNDEVVGILALYAADAGFFDAEEMRLLEELAGDVSFALDNIEKAKKLDYISYYDSLTGLANRALFHERLKMQMQDAGRKGEAIVLKILDLERFKAVNDGLGRQAGDALLAELVRRMDWVRPASSWLARLAADQFAIVTPGLSSEDDLARDIERRFGETFGKPFDIAGRELRISARMGVAVFPADGADSEALLHNAEAALKKAKSSGERYVFYRQEMTARIAERLTFESRLRQALEKEEFVLHYQPKVDTASRRIVGLEALIRWQSPDLGLVAPMRFIPILEETGLILDVGTWVLERAVQDARRWTAAGINPPRIAVNVSATQLRRGDFASTVARAVKQAARPVGIDVEVTESVVMADILESTTKLEAVRALGVGVAIDDFGTGYSSLAYLARLPVETLKIDRSFVSTMSDDATSRTLVQTIISLAHSLRLTVVAEGVETEVQAKMLGELGCHQVQGYLTGKPLPWELTTELLRR